MKTVYLGRCEYRDVFEAMQRFTAERDDATPDELWLCEHHAVYTQGVAGRAEHVLDARAVPVVQSNRGGQVTYHGPGQVVAYPLVNLRRLGLHVKTYVHRLEEAVLRMLAGRGVTGHRVPGAPGIYVLLRDPFSHALLDAHRAHTFDGLGKIAALGIKVSRHYAYHGVALNVAMDLAPFERINPCGYEGLRTVDLATLGVALPWADAAADLAQRLDRQLALPEGAP